MAMQLPILLIAARLKGSKTWTSEEWQAQSNKRRLPRAEVLRKPPFVQWWRGLDSNQRTLARADLQSAAFNHSATSPDCAGQMASASLTVNRNAGPVVSDVGACCSNLAHQGVPGLERVKGIEPSS